MFLAGYSTVAGGGSVHDLEVGGGLLEETCGGGFGMLNLVGIAFHTTLCLDSAFINCESSKCSAQRTQFLYKYSELFPNKFALLVFWTHFRHLQ